MPDREKVIRGLEICKPSKYSRTCGICPYREEMNCDYELYNDALALLNEREAVEPKQVGLHGKEDWYGPVCVCPDCKAEWMSAEADIHFCPTCGRAVKWE